MGQRQGVAFVTLLLGRLAVRKGHYGEGRQLLERATNELRRMNLAIYVGLARGCLAEAEAFGGDPARAVTIADELIAAGGGNTALPRRTRAIALARGGCKALAVEALEQSVAAATTAGSDYDLAAGLDLLDALGAAGSRTGQRDAIVTRLRIERLPRPALEKSTRPDRGDLTGLEAVDAVDAAEPVASVTP